MDCHGGHTHRTNIAVSIAHDAAATKLYGWKVHQKIRYFEKHINAVISKLLSVDSQWVALVVTDHCTLIAKQSYCGMSAHWIHGDFNIHNKALGCWVHEGNLLSDTLSNQFMLNLFIRYNFDKLNIIAFL